MRYEDVEPSEAVDLIATLPQGSLYRSALLGYTELDERRELAYDIVDELRRFMTLYATGSTKDAALTVRPEHAALDAERRKRAKTALRKIEETEWEEV